MKVLKKIIPGIALVAIIALAVLSVTTTSLEAVKEMTQRGYLGVSIEKLTHQDKKEMGIGHGVRVVQVEKGEAGDKAGLKEDDVILFFDGEKMFRPNDLVDAVRDKKPGTKVDIKVFRDGKSKKLSAVLGELKIRKWSGGDFTLSPGHSRGYLGVALNGLKGDLASYFGVKPGLGVLILEVADESPALEAGLKSGDVIVKFDGADVSEPRDIQEILADLKAGATVTVDVIRHKKKKSIKVELGESPGFLKGINRFGNFFRVPQGEDKLLFFDRNFKGKEGIHRKLKKRGKSKARIFEDNIYI